MTLCRHIIPGRNRKYNGEMITAINNEQPVKLLIIKTLFCLFTLTTLDIWKGLNCILFEPTYEEVSSGK